MNPRFNTALFSPVVTLRAIRAVRLARRVEVLFAKEGEDAVKAATPKYGCLMAMVPEVLGQEIINWGEANIAESEVDLAEGRETEPHVTVFYGFLPEMTEDNLTLILSRYNSLEFIFGKVSRFECENYDVVKIEMMCSGANKLHRHIAEQMAHEVVPSKYRYNAHLTLAYVKKGECRHLDGKAPFAGRSFTVDELLFSWPEKQGRKTFSLGENAQAISATEPREKVLRPVNAIRTKTESFYDDAIHRAIIAAEALALQQPKQKERHDKEKALIALFLLWLLNATEEAYSYAAPALADLAMGVDLLAGRPSKVEAAAFALSRQPLLADIPQRILDELDLEVTRGREQAETPGEIARRVKVIAKEIEERERKKISATEAQAVLGQAQLRALKQAGFTKKKWITEDDDRVRDSHRNCEDQGAIPITERFINGLICPGDPVGGPEETVNCRCFLQGVR